MEKANGNKHRIVQLLLVAVILVTAVVSVPSTNAKYTTSKTYTINISSFVKGLFVYTTASRVLCTDEYTDGSRTVTLPFPGKYLIIAKGGDGADGFATFDDTTGTADKSGGVGGRVWGIYTAPSNTSTTNPKYLYVCVGAKGNRPTKGTVGGAGQNAGVSGYNGGSGSKFEAGWFQLLASSVTADAASGGGGAATAVYLGSNSSGMLLMVAGGGGASACYNSTLAGFIGIVECGEGGDGGNGNATGSNLIINGVNGTGDSWKSGRNTYTSYGTAGTSSVGSGGSVESETIWVGIIPYTINRGSGHNGSNGTGGNSYYYGGGGGGGYRGGGGGAGTSIDHPAGGGGGGSSFISGQLAGLTSAQETIALQQISEAGIPTQYNTDANKKDGDGDGYVIVYYLGPAT